jgi:spermidine/putrescine-binding protein
VLAIIAKVFGGAEDNPAPAWERLTALRPAVGRTPVALMQLLEREEIGIAPVWNNDAAGAIARGLPIRFVQPAPGPVSLLSFMSEITNTRHPELVHEWMNECVGSWTGRGRRDAPEGSAMPSCTGLTPTARHRLRRLPAPPSWREPASCRAATSTSA